MSDNIPQDSVAEIDVIMRTLAEKKRAGSLLRALDSVQSQCGVSTRTIVVVNGARYDQDLIDRIKKRPDVEFAYLSESSLIASGRRGRELVTAPFFTFLDDDDELITDSLLEPVTWLRGNRVYDLVVTRTDMSSRSPLGERMKVSPQSSPLLRLLDECWLHPGAGLFRADTMGTDVLNVSDGQMEWTRAAFRLLMGNTRIHFMDVSTVIYHDTSESLSKNLAHQVAELDLLKEIMLTEGIDAPAKRRAEEKHANTLHMLSATHRSQGRRREAWKMHLKSLRSGYFFRYVLYTRKLLF